MNPNLANGQIVTRLRLNLAGAQQQEQQQQIVDAQTQFNNGQFSYGQRLLAQQLAANAQLQSLNSPSTASPLVFPQSAPSSLPQSSSSYVNLNDPANVQYIDDTNDGSHVLFKRNGNQNKQPLRRRVKAKRVTRAAKSTIRRTPSVSDKNNKKRALVQLTDGSVIDDKDLIESPFGYDGLSQFGAEDFQENLSKQSDIEDEIREHDREPAEEEVRAVLELCSTCENEPFQGAVIMAWKNVKVQLEHALRGHSIGGCGQF